MLPSGIQISFTRRSLKQSIEEESISIADSQLLNIATKHANHSLKTSRVPSFYLPTTANTIQELSKKRSKLNWPPKHSISEAYVAPFKHDSNSPARKQSPPTLQPGDVTVQIPIKAQGSCRTGYMVGLALSSLPSHLTFEARVKAPGPVLAAAYEPSTAFRCIP